MKFEVLTPLLKLFTLNMVQGAANLQPEALWLLGLFFGGELVVTGMVFVLRRELQWDTLVWKVVTAAVFLWLINHWVPLTTMLVRSFIQAGLKMGGDVLSETDYTDPDNIAGFGLTVTGVVFTQLTQYAGWNPLKYLVEILGNGVTAWLTVVFYLGMGIWVFVTLLEFYLSTALSIILLPWAMFSKTAWVTEKALAHCFASGVRQLVLAGILGLALPMLVQTQMRLGTSFAAVISMLCGAIALLILCLRANTFAQGLVYGGPQLVLQDATRAMATLTTQLTQLGSTLQTLVDLAARTDPEHPARQQAASRRRP